MTRKQSLSLIDLIMGELLGIIGVIFAIPAAVIVMKLLDEFTSPSKSPASSVEK